MKRHNCQLTRNSKGLWTTIYNEATKITIASVEQIKQVLLHDESILLIYNNSRRNLKCDGLTEDIFDALIWARHENQQFRENIS